MALFDGVPWALEPRCTADTRAVTRRTNFKARDKFKENGTNSGSIYCLSSSLQTLKCTVISGVERRLRWVFRTRRLELITTSCLDKRLDFCRSLEPAISQPHSTSAETPPWRFGILASRVASLSAQAISSKDMDKPNLRHSFDNLDHRIFYFQPRLQALQQVSKSSNPL